MIIKISTKKVHNNLIPENAISKKNFLFLF